MAMRVGISILAGLASLAVVSTAYADDPPVGQGRPSGGNKLAGSAAISVVSGDEGVTIYIAIAETTPGSPGAEGEEELISGPDGPSCTADLMNIGNASLGWVRQGLEEHPDTTPWFVICDNGYVGVAWVPNDAPGAPAVEVVEGGVPAIDPEAVAASVLGIVPIPPIAVGANPDVGLVAVPSWYWVEGYDGSTLRGSRTLGLITIEVEITPSSYRWTFGDGATLETLSLGQRYPTPSDITHTYERSSLDAGGTFEVQLDITFDARYRVNGGAWLPLAPVVQSYTRAYPVQQLQSVLTGG